jgi:hypothetical protein
MMPKGVEHTANTEQEAVSSAQEAVLLTTDCFLLTGAMNMQSSNGAPALPRISTYPPCIATTAEGTICGQPAQMLDLLRGGLVCLHCAAIATEPRLTGDELAMALQVNRRSVQRWTRQGMPCIPVGRLPRYVQSECEAWLRRRAVLKHAAREARRQRWQSPAAEEQP